MVGAELWRDSPDYASGAAGVAGFLINGNPFFMFPFATTRQRPRGSSRQRQIIAFLEQARWDRAKAICTKPLARQGYISVAVG